MKKISKRNIKAIQAEHERLNLVISEFAGDRSVSRGARAVKDRRDAVWALVEKLKLAFTSEEPEKHALFKHATQLTPEGYRCIFNCYESGISRLNVIVDQDIAGTDTSPKSGRGAREIQPMKAGQMTQQRRSTKVSTMQTLQ